MLGTQDGQRAGQVAQECAGTGEVNAARHLTGGRQGVGAESVPVVPKLLPGQMPPSGRLPEQKRGGVIQFIRLPRCPLASYPKHQLNVIESVFATVQLQVPCGPTLSMVFKLL